MGGTSDDVVLVGMFTSFEVESVFEGFVVHLPSDDGCKESRLLWEGGARRGEETDIGMFECLDFDV